MKILRSHILRIAVVTLLLSGFGMFFIQPVQGDSDSRAFAHWLSTMAEYSAEAADISHELDQLKGSDLQIAQMIEKASQIVTQNSEDFQYPLQASAVSSIYQLLLMEWNQFKTDNAMAAVPVRPVVKMSAPFNLDKIGAFVDRNIVYKNVLPASLNTMEMIPELSRLPITIMPMADCIAIGAP